MSCNRLALRGLVAVFTALGGVAAAQAAPVVQAGAASGAPEALVAPSLQFSFDSPYAVLSFGLQFSYDASLLTFDAAASKVILDGVEVAFGAAIAGLPPLEFSATYGTDEVTGLAFADYSYIPMASVPVQQSLVFLPAFRLAASALPGQQTLIEFSGDLADDATGLETTFAVSSVVTAVPEPATWLSLCAGLAALAAAARRRRAAC
ncbi:PEP-CTERM sorting domain-containing protein [Aquincola sp. MAHUQ-54]|uniref:PEP-CTERM sorting domain-containing protein n=1 Tax=Aquincola agrisoli TaxID=3119538 RepID=A0AAW9QHC8_9BURK